MSFIINIKIIYINSSIVFVFPVSFNILDISRPGKRMKISIEFFRQFETFLKKKKKEASSGLRKELVNTFKKKAFSCIYMFSFGASQVSLEIVLKEASHFSQLFT